jgi:hypothetical protein
MYSRKVVSSAISVEKYDRSELALSDFIVARIQDKPHCARLRAGVAIEAVMKMDGEWLKLAY